MAVIWEQVSNCFINLFSLYCTAAKFLSIISILISSAKATNIPILSAASYLWRYVFSPVTAIKALSIKSKDGTRNESSFLKHEKSYAKASKFPLQNVLHIWLLFWFTSVEMVLFYKVKRFYHLYLGYKLQSN